MSRCRATQPKLAAQAQAQAVVAAHALLVVAAHALLVVEAQATARVAGPLSRALLHRRAGDRWPASSRGC